MGYLNRFPDKPQFPVHTFRLSGFCPCRIQWGAAMCNERDNASQSCCWNHVGNCRCAFGTLSARAWQTSLCKSQLNNESAILQRGRNVTYSNVRFSVLAVCALMALSLCVVPHLLARKQRNGPSPSTCAPTTTSTNEAISTLRC